MKKANADLDRLLRSASTASPFAPEVPYGFETRVVALWRAGIVSADDAVELAQFLRRIGVIAVVVLTIASVSVFRQFNDIEARTVPHTNEYAIVDSAIQTEFSQ